MVSMEAALEGRLDFRHRAPSKPMLAPGRHSLGLFDERDAVLVVPPGLEASGTVPLMVLFHGGGGSAEKILPIMEDHALANRFLLLAPQSLMPTWDIVIAGNGPDRERLDLALGWVADRFPLDAGRLAFAGHSDGGSYALSNGLCNGDVVSHVIAYSAGFMSVLAQAGAPFVFVAHGKRDEQTPIETAGRSHAQRLKAAGYDVTYLEFDGPHRPQPAIVEAGVRFFLRYPPAGRASARAEVVRE